MSDTNLMLAGAFVATTGLAAAAAAYGAVRLATDLGDDARVRQRLRPHAGDARRAAADSLARRARAAVKTLGDKISRTFAGDADERGTRLRRKLIAAGIYQADAPRLFIAARVALGFVGVALGFLASLAGMSDLATCVAVGGLFGYMAPQAWLKFKTKANLKQLANGLPDALDLMVVCVEAGLTIDAAMQRVGDELALAHPTISRELAICHMETRIGLPRGQALRNLGDRTNFPPLQGLAAMLIQAERFGTSIARALRIQADGLRAKRQHKAEEEAAKASVKLTFPLVLFIFPASFIVMAGPVVLKMMESGMF